MKLRTITNEFGLSGLLDRFNMEVDRLPFDDPNDRLLIDDALHIALQAHQEHDYNTKNNRDGLPYFTHVARVATRLVCYLGVTDPATIITALFHDVVEDCPEELLRGSGRELSEPDRPIEEVRQAALVFISQRFGARGKDISNLVAALTNPEFNNSQDRNTQYQRHVRELLVHPNKRVGLIKLADFMDNAVGLSHGKDLERKQRLPGKYAPLIPDMRAFANKWLSSDALSYTTNRLDTAEVRFAALQFRTEQRSAALGVVAIAD